MAPFLSQLGAHTRAMENDKADNAPLSKTTPRLLLSTWRRDTQKVQAIHLLGVFV
jgi:hypothetical protein